MFNEKILEITTESITALVSCFNPGVGALLLPVVAGLKLNNAYKDEEELKEKLNAIIMQINRIIANTENIKRSYRADILYPEIMKRAFYITDKEIFVEILNVSEVMYASTNIEFNIFIEISRVFDLLNENEYKLFRSLPVERFNWQYINTNKIYNTLNSLEKDYGYIVLKNLFTKGIINAKRKTFGMDIELIIKDDKDEYMELTVYGKKINESINKINLTTAST